MSTAYPTDHQARARERQRIRSNYLNRAKVEAEQFGRSIRCAEGDHGCANSGSSCICECHDVGDAS